MNRPDFDAGLVPAIVQDSQTGGVLMLGYMNEEAWDATQDTGYVHFWSRSRNELWKKGETSGNTLRVDSWALDCDRDTVLVQATPAGPTCHTGSVSCLGDRAATPTGVLAQLESVIRDRAEAPPADSYTAKLLAAGPTAIGRKIIEEAVEVLVAGKDHAAGEADDRRLAEEAADLVYHLMVLLRSRDLALSDVTSILSERRR